jgi:hypothetical protein
MKMITIVCGGRNNVATEPWAKFFKNTQTNHVIAGGARGADVIAGAYAISAGIKTTVIEPDWDKHGIYAGFERNVKMAEFAKSLVEEHGGAVQVVAVAGGKGTAHMLKIGKQYGFKVCCIEGSK